MGSDVTYVLSDCKFSKSPKYFSFLILNGAMLLKLLSEVLGLKPESKELYVAMFFRNFISIY